MGLTVSAEKPFEVRVNYLDTDGYNQHFVRETFTDSLKKLKKRLGLPDEVNWIEIDHPRMEVAPADMPMGDYSGETERRKWKLVPSAQWEIHASSDDGEDAEGNLINWVDHSPDLKKKEVLKVIEEFFLHPDFLGFQSKEEFP